MEDNILHIGLDVGSTTVKTVIMDNKLEIIYSSYERHFSNTKQTVYNCLKKIINEYNSYKFTIGFTGSGAMSVAEFVDLPFIQEVIACKRAVEKNIPQTDVVIELGGEDAKIIYFKNAIEERMNGSCAGRNRSIFGSDGTTFRYRYNRTKWTCKKL